MHPKHDAVDAALKTLTRYGGFIGRNQLRAIRDARKGEEREFFVDKLIELGGIVETMPKTYDQDGLGDQAVAHLHYFSPSADWYITEKDAGTPDEPGQHRAFGLADLGYGGELGYISIVELLENNVELDLYFTPCKLAEIRKAA